MTPGYTLGLQAPGSQRVGKVRKAAVVAPKRTGDLWETVNVVREHDTSPHLSCKNCGANFCGGATRITQHVIEKCSADSPEFLALKEKLLDRNGAFHNMKRQRATEAEVSDAAAVEETIVQREKKKKKFEQQGIHASLNAAKSEECDDAIAEMWFGLNLPAAKIDHPLVKKCFKKMQFAPPSYVLPNRQRMYGELLERTSTRLRAEESLTRENMLKNGCTITSDGWDNVASDHLINVLVGVNAGAFFEGTYKLSSTDAENAPAVFKLLMDQIDRIGPLSVVQVCTDTCAVMRAAWKLVEAKYPWIACTCCAPHVLSLYLKDIGKIDAVACVLAKVTNVLNRFWGKTRWPRTKLRETAAQNHGKALGLYRAKVTRFAGRVREMARMLRLKSDLQQVVVCAEYSAAKFNVSSSDSSGGGVTVVLGANDPVKTIILDEQGFWEPLVATLKIMTPIVKLLRLTDGLGAAMGKIYPKMVAIRESIQASTVSWKAEALKLHDYRWNYLKSDMHLAGYALDPEYIDCSMDSEVQSALIATAERMALRSVMMKHQSEGSADVALHLTVENESVQQAVGQAMMQLASYQDKEGIFSKQFVRQHAKEMSPAKWWDKYGKAVPDITSVACSVLTQPVSASAAERNWSVYGAIMSSGRSRMSHVIADHLVYCHETLHLREKLQKSGYKEPTIKWDSDSDEGTSSDDDDLKQ